MAGISKAGIGNIDAMPETFMSVDTEINPGMTC
jgi:hypothetical protein